MQMETLYQEIILDHYRTRSTMACGRPFDAEAHHVNPTCGDEVTVRVRIETASSRTCLATRVWVLDQPGQRLGDDRAGPRAVPWRCAALQQEFLASMQGRGAVEPDEDRLEDAVAFASKDLNGTKAPPFAGERHCVLEPVLVGLDRATTLHEGEELLLHRQRILEGTPDHQLGHHRRGRLPDRAAQTLVGDVLDDAVLDAHANGHLVAAGRVDVVRLSVVRLRSPRCCGCGSGRG